MWHALGNNWPFGQENLFVQKNTSKWAILVCTNLGYQTSEGPGRQTIDTRSTWGIITLRTSYVEGRWHQNWAHRSLLHFFMCVHGNSRKSNFLGKTLRTRKFSTKKNFGAATSGILTHSGFRKYSLFGWPSLRFEVIEAQSQVIGQKPVVFRGVTPPFFGTKRT